MRPCAYAQVLDGGLSSMLTTQGPKSREGLLLYHRVLGFAGAPALARTGSLQLCLTQFLDSASPPSIRPFPHLQIGIGQCDDAIKPPWSGQGRVQRLRPVGRSKDHHARVVIKSIQLCVGGRFRERCTLVLPRAGGKCAAKGQ